MKKIIYIALLCSACTSEVRHPIPETNNWNPADSVIRRLIEQKYTSQNAMDGMEYATVESIVIKDVSMNVKDSICIVKYHISCSYSPAAMPPDHQGKAPDALNEDVTDRLRYENGQWQIETK